MSEQEGEIKGNYAQSMTIHAPPEQIFDFVADIGNMPKYLPTTKSAQPQGDGDRVRVQGEAQGHRYDADGFLRADRDAMKLEWGADEDYYAGKLQITPQGDDAANVNVELSFNGKPPGAGRDRPSDEQINEGLQKALESIENHVTGKGGKEEPSAAT